MSVSKGRRYIIRAVVTFNVFLLEEEVIRSCYEVQVVGEGSIHARVRFNRLAHGPLCVNGTDFHCVLSGQDGRFVVAAERGML